MAAETWTDAGQAPRCQECGKRLTDGDCDGCAADVEQDQDDDRAERVNNYWQRVTAPY